MELNKIFNLKTIKTNKPGELHFTDYNNNFDIKRIFLINNFNDLTDKNSTRGLHANINFDEIIIVNEGSIKVKIINKNNEENVFLLKKNQCLYFSRGYWLEFSIIDVNTSLTIIANETFETSKSEYDLKTFITSK